MKDEFQCIVGRGKVYLNGLYIGNTPSFRLLGVSPDGIRRISFATDVISDENLSLYVNAGRYDTPKRYVVDYKADNPAGRNIDFHFPVVKLLAGKWEQKGEEWQQMEMIGELFPDLETNTLFTYTHPQTVRVPA